MPKVHVLDKHTAELIAAGEVVERPASVVKELMENAIDAGASVITVEIRNGGVRSMVVTDDGCGMEREDVPTAFLRHATSKVRTEDDLDAIGTLGFRGEALASIAAVAHVRLVTRRARDDMGTCYTINGGDAGQPEDCGCACGTVISVDDLFYNVPARMKFLKRDVSEGNAVAGVVEKLSLSHPEISFRFMRDGREELLTPGDGKLYSTIYAVFGKAFAETLMPVSYRLGGVAVEGFICHPTSGRSNRMMQHFFVNGRYVKTRTALAALEQAYKGSLMVGKFPACVLALTMPPETVDANVHPSKVEVRFINERPVFDAVYHGVKSALESDTHRKEVTLPALQRQQTAAPVQMKLGEGVPNPPHAAPAKAPQTYQVPKMQAASGMPPLEKAVFRKRPVCPETAEQAVVLHDDTVSEYHAPEQEEVQAPAIPVCTVTEAEARNAQTPAEKPPEAEIPQAPPAVGNEPVRYLGEVFHTYILVEAGDAVSLIDKHAAHERILYNQLKQQEKHDSQMLLSPEAVTLGREEYAALTAELPMLREAGFEVDDFGDSTLLVRAVPMILSGSDANALLQEIAGGFASGRREIMLDKLDWIYHSTACRAAIKAGNLSKPEELKRLAERVMSDNSIRFCPHGRPVVFTLTRKEIEKQFGRIV